MAAEFLSPASRPGPVTGETPVIGLGREREVLTVALQAARHVVLEGPPGTGKSTLLRAIARDLGQAVVFVEGNAELTPARLIGQYDPAQVLTEGSAIRGVAIGGDGGGLRCRSVIICSGGFAGNRDMVLEQAPRLRSLPRLLSGGSPHAVGAGHRLLAAAGAAFTCLDHIWVYPNGTPDPCDPRGERGLGIRGLAGEIWLNADGRRFHDEGLNGGRSGTAALLAQPGQTCWCVFGETQLESLLLIDNEYFGTPAGPHPEAMARFWAESRYAWRAEGPEQLAAAAGLPPDAVRASVDEFNAAIRAGLDRDLQTGRDLRGLAPLEGPLAAIQYFPMAQKNFGGVRTDLDCRVLDESGEVISGLFAAGEVAGMAGGCINGRSALEGTMFGPCLYSGRVAGIAAAAVVGALR